METGAWQDVYCSLENGADFSDKEVEFCKNEDEIIIMKDSNKRCDRLRQFRQ